MCGTRHGKLIDFIDRGGAGHRAHGLRSEIVVVELLHRASFGLLP